ncbi:MAG: arsenical resistance operon transcriptional repressor ArsD [Acidiferrobacteraceae bacterium]|nr:arsenical resistance operon transcriptional repressor ArsD [Acidiferrobacteraceae bacterium]|tara:strand:- start:267 stop:620 length:354 start_codon:yes stop_codon:yes gene_type:complete
MTSKLVVYDPVQCCATGACGPDSDDEPAQFAASLEWLKESGVQVERFNLGFQPGEFATNSVVKTRLEQDGIDCLPLLIADGEIIKSGGYLSRDALAIAFHLEAPKAEKKTSSRGCCS